MPLKYSIFGNTGVDGSKKYTQAFTLKMPLKITFLEK
jgi:hypothetical protein